jgi:hypothetical protein
MCTLTSSLEYDESFQQNVNLAWRPWVGTNYSRRESSRKLLIVGESHYFGEVTQERYVELLQSHKEDVLHTRHAFDEFMLKRQTRIKTYENIPRLLLGTDRFDRDRFWRDTAFYNFIQVPMRKNGRPSPDQFVHGWKVFADLVKLLQPSHCLFIGVSAANSFNYVMNDLGFPEAKIQMTGKVGSTHGRAAKIHYDGNSTELMFVKHLGARMSPLAWNQHLRKMHPGLIEWLEAEQYSCSLSRPSK